MAGLRVFVSSTCYDLGAVRAQLRVFVQSLGHEPIMSDYNDVLFNPEVHTHTSCIDEVINGDVLVLIIGAIFGGSAIPEAMDKIDFESLLKESRSVEMLKSGNFSITQLEILKAIELGIPVFAFVDERVLHDHELYERNKGNKAIIDKIDFPSIQKKETARYVFEFINFLRLRIRNNGIFPFGKTQDIEEILRRQWSGLFQRLIKEQKRHSVENRSIDKISQQLADLRAAVLATASTEEKGKIARGVIRFRRLVDFLIGLRLPNWDIVYSEQEISWQNLLKAADIVEQFEIPSSPKNMRVRGFLIKSDRTYYEVRYPFDLLDRIKRDWIGFIEYEPDSRRIIVEALQDAAHPLLVIRYIPHLFDINRFYRGEEEEFGDPNESLFEDVK